MSNRKSSKADKYTEIRDEIGHLSSAGESGDEVIDVCLRRFVEITIDGHQYPTELNAWEARKMGRALIKADKLDGGS
jgi:hypothetical protein